METVKTLQNRRTWILAGAILLLVAALVYGAWSTIGPSTKYQGLTLTGNVELDDATRTIYTQRIQVTQSAIASQKESGEDVDLNLYLSLAWDANAIGDLVLARETYEEFLDANPLYFAAWNTYGNVLKDMGDEAGALGAYKQAIDLEPTEGFYRDYYEQYVKLYPEDKEGALRILEEAVQNVSQTPWLMVELAAWHLADGNCEEAFNHYDVAETLIPENQSLQDLIAQARTQCAK